VSSLPHEFLDWVVLELPVTRARGLSQVDGTTATSNSAQGRGGGLAVFLAGPAQNGVTVILNRVTLLHNTANNTVAKQNGGGGGAWVLQLLGQNNVSSTELVTPKL
jgi:hypothetical protein